MARALRVLTQLMGWTCVAIGLLHVALGNAAIPGAGSAGTTIDSWGRFMGASFVGYRLAWLWAARRRRSQLGRCGGWPAFSCWAAWADCSRSPCTAGPSGSRLRWR